MLNLISDGESLHIIYIVDFNNSLKNTVAGSSPL